eukprot:TRINITY_DN39577_c0_g3_i1.p1 TRINITY_DN39577_c0_g3~~TRINITY_DN39577_c0_g3_i1.p1  ORF type:complete len:261 (+),score=71.31 TRINITY_DN39577_c0_g3_i1:106-888(+)
MSGQERVRVLAFHSFRSCGQALEAGLFQTSFLAHLRDLIDFVWIDAPYECTPEEKEHCDEAELVGDKTCEWYRPDKKSKDDPLEYLRFWDSVKYVAEILKDKGPFDGVLGYGQGAAFCHALLLLQREGHDLLEDTSELKFCILISGTKCGAKDLLHLYKGAPFKIPALCIWNMEDPLVKPRDSEDLACIFNNPCVIQKGLRVHELPKLNKDEVNMARKWLKHTISEMNKPSNWFSMVLVLFIGVLALLTRLYTSQSRRID